MVPLPLFRDKLTLVGALASSDPNRRWDGNMLMAWLRRESVSVRGWVILMAVWAAVNIVLFAASNVVELPRAWQILPVLYFGATVMKLRELGDLFENALSLSEALETVGAVFQHLETYRYDGNEHLEDALCAVSSTRITAHRSSFGVARIVSAVSIQKNPLLGC